MWFQFKWMLNVNLKHCFSNWTLHTSSKMFYHQNECCYIIEESPSTEQIILELCK